MDLIAVDIGNSRITLGVFVEDKLERTEHVPVDQPEKLSTILKEFRILCGPQEHGAQTVPVVVCSVNPNSLADVEKALLQTLDQNVLLVGRNVPLDLKIAVEDSDSIGSDRLLNAAAAYDVVQTAVVVADFGTATTIDCVNEMGIFLGGVIMPGLGLAAKSLHAFTAQLPEVPVELPNADYGTNTISSIQSGIYFAALGTLREMTERFATQLGQWPQVIATGGYCKLIAQKCDMIDSVVPDLCLNGIFLAYKKLNENPTESNIE
ncbi:MAG: type III pantothenate kinase [Nitrospinae bacterium]|nr:type III pantothenate kinase [Nitrospinota bacterium]